MSSVLHAIEDAIFGGRPKRWSAPEWDTFNRTYDEIGRGVFTALDLLPPTSIPGVGVKAISLSLKGMISGVNRGQFAKWVDTLNAWCADGGSTRDFYDTYFLSGKMNVPGYSTEAVFTITLALHDAVFPRLRRS